MKASRLTTIRFHKFRKLTNDQPMIQNMIEVSLRKKLALTIEYVDSKGDVSNRSIEPLFIDQHGNVRAWDNRRNDYRSFTPTNIKCAQWNGFVFSTKERNIPDNITANFRAVV